MAESAAEADVATITSARPPWVRAILVGRGPAVDDLARAIGRIHSTDLVAVCDPFSDDSADFGRVLAEARPDVVHVATPPPTHAPLARTALAAGAHVFAEVPFAAGADEVAEVLAAADRHGRLVCVGHDLLFDPCWGSLAAVAARGDFGRVVRVEATAGPDPDGDPFRGPVARAMAAILVLLPGDPEVAAVEGSPAELRAELRGGGATAAVTAGTAARPSVRVIGSRCGAELDIDTGVIRPLLPDGSPESAGLFGRVGGWVRAACRAVRGGPEAAGRDRLLRAFYRAVLVGGDAPVPYPLVRRAAELTAAVLTADRHPGCLS